jgi:hypothetical protein
MPRRFPFPEPPFPRESCPPTAAFEKMPSAFEIFPSDIPDPAPTAEGDIA